MFTRQWSTGDQVVHAARPEWGPGQVILAESSVHDGKACQRLTIRFSRGGTRTVTTALAELVPASDAPKLSESPQDASPGDPLAAAAGNMSVEQAMLRIPERATDPFSDIFKRLAATLELYRYGETGAGLLDWACMQTGLKDPLTRFNRHELEQWYAKFLGELDGHLKKLVRDARRENPGMVNELASKVSNTAQRALRRADIGR